MILGIIVAVCAYFIGNLDFAYIVVRAAIGKDIRDYGSGNAGTTNVLRTLGLKYAVLVFIFDALKGAVAIWAARLLGLDEAWVALAGAAVICGHNWPICLGFRGGKGTATSIGVFVAMDWKICLICVIVGLIFLVIFRMMSLTSIVGMITLPIAIIIMYGITPMFFLGLFMCISTVFQHRSNIVRIANGTESKVGQKVKIDEQQNNNKNE